MHAYFTVLNGVTLTYLGEESVETPYATGLDPDPLSFTQHQIHAVLKLQKIRPGVTSVRTFLSKYLENTTGENLVTVAEL